MPKHAEWNFPRENWLYISARKFYHIAIFPLGNSTMEISVIFPRGEGWGEWGEIYYLTVPSLSFIEISLVILLCYSQKK